MVYLYIHKHIYIHMYVCLYILIIHTFRESEITQFCPNNITRVSVLMREHVISA